MEPKIMTAISWGMVTTGAIGLVAACQGRVSVALRPGRGDLPIPGSERFPDKA